MSNQPLKVTAQTLSELLANTDTNILESLRNSVYPGAKDESISMVLSYCQAKGIDPLAKAVHIVPMSVKNALTGSYDFKDVIMPGIASYRIDAERSGVYMGITAPEFGPIVTQVIGSKEVSYPEWCKVSVKKLVHGVICEFEAMEFWIENYANKGKDRQTRIVDTTPNEMWFKRPRGQLAKCAEAQALRRAFSGIITSVPTFEEMEGKDFIQDSKEYTLVEVSEPIRPEHVELLKDKMKESNTKEVDVCKHLRVEKLSDLRSDAMPELLRLLELKISKKKKVEALPINSLLNEPEISISSSEIPTE